MTAGRPPSTPRGRRPGPDSSKQAVLDAARRLFSENGFERTTIRAIASSAAVDPALVHHFFGTKEQLFRASLELPFDPSEVFLTLDDHRGTEGVALVRGVLAIWREPAVREQFTAMLRAAVTHEHARTALRDLLTSQVLGLLADRMDDEDAPLRAALVGSQMAGLALTRLIMELEPLTSADDEVLVAAIGPTVQRYLTGDLHPTA